MIRYVFLLFLLLVPHSSFAQGARIETGEHGTFTRVSIPMPRGANWTVNQDGQKILVKIDGISNFDLNPFFDLIGRDRISSVEMNSSAGTLDITTSCACGYETFVYKKRFLIIDVLPRDPPQENVKSVMQLGLPILNSGPYIQQPKVQDPLTPSFDGLELLTSLENSIIRGLADAASQGLIEPATALPEINRVVVYPDLEHHPMVSTKSSLSQQKMKEDDLQTTDGQICLPSDLVDISAWVSEAGFADEIAKNRPFLLAEFDRPSYKHILGLARSYVQFGFGAEALITLSLLGAQTQETEIVKVIAEIIDEMPVDSTILAGQFSCDTPVALWSLLSSPEQGYDQPLAHNAILRTLHALPDHIQDLLAPRVADRFLAIGDTNAARMALDQGETTVPSVIKTAQLEAATGDTIAATSRLAALTRSDNRAGMNAMIDYFDLAVATNQTIETGMFDIADAMRFENRQHPNLPDLIYAQAMAMIYDQQLSRVLQVVDENQSTLSADRFDALMTDIAIAAVENLNDADFVTLSFERSFERISPSAKGAIANRLVDLGFPERAVRLLNVAQGQEIPKSDKILARANTLLDIPNFSEKAKISDAGVLAFDDVAEKSGEPDRVSTSPSGNTFPTLETGRNLIRESAQARASLQELLEKFPLTAEDS